jgi:hypothetical protein
MLSNSCFLMFSLTCHGTHFENILTRLALKTPIPPISHSFPSWKSLVCSYINEFTLPCNSPPLAWGRAGSFALRCRSVVTEMFSESSIQCSMCLSYIVKGFFTSGTLCLIPNITKVAHSGLEQLLGWKKYIGAGTYVFGNLIASQLQKRKN